MHGCQLCTPAAARAAQLHAGNCSLLSRAAAVACLSACLLLLSVPARPHPPYRPLGDFVRLKQQTAAQLVCELGPRLSSSAVVALEPLLSGLLCSVPPSAGGSEALTWLLAAAAYMPEAGQAQAMVYSTWRTYQQLHHGACVPEAFTQLWLVARWGCWRALPAPPFACTALS